MVHSLLADGRHEAAISNMVECVCVGWVDTEVEEVGVPMVMIGQYTYIAPGCVDGQKTDMHQ